MSQASQKWGPAYAILIFKQEEGEVYETLSGKIVQDRSEISADSLQISDAGLTSFSHRVLTTKDQWKTVSNEH